MYLLLLFVVVSVGVSFLMGISFVHRKLFPRKRDLDLLLQTPIILFAITSLLATVVDRFTELSLLSHYLSHLSWLILLLEVYFYPKYLYTLFGRPFYTDLYYKGATVFWMVFYVFLVWGGMPTLFFIICSLYSALFLLFFSYLFLPKLDKLHSVVKQDFIRGFLILNIFLALALTISAIFMSWDNSASLNGVLVTPVLIYTICISILTVRAYLAEIMQVREQRASKDQVHDFCIRYALTTREKEVLEQVILKLKNREIADFLHISQHTVKAHLKNLYTKTGATDKESLIALLNSHQ